MSKVVNLGDKGGGRPHLMKVLDASDLEGKKVPERDWLIGSILVRRSITLFGGDGGVGKSLACQMLQVAAGLGRDWLGIPIPVMNSFALYCEDDEDELHRRFNDICQFFGCKFKDLDGRVRYVSRVGEENELVQYNGRGDRVRPEQTALMQQVRYEVTQNNAQLVILDTAGDVFGGNENVRSQVRSFVNIIRGLTMGTGGGVILTAHPSKASMVDGSNFSGSTAWHGSCRNRIFLTRPKQRNIDGEEDDKPTDHRVLKIMKSNYSQGGGKIECKWERGVFIEDLRAVTQSTYQRLEIDRKVLDAASWLVQRGAKLGAIPTARTSLVVKVRDLDSCKDFSFGDVKKASERLIEGGKLVMVEIGPQSKRQVYLRPSHLRYPGEDIVGATGEEHPDSTVPEGGLL